MAVLPAHRVAHVQLAEELAQERVQAFEDRTLAELAGLDFGDEIPELEKAGIVELVSSAIGKHTEQSSWLLEVGSVVVHIEFSRFGFLIKNHGKNVE